MCQALTSCISKDDHPRYSSLLLYPPWEQACNWVWDDWDDWDSKGIWEIYASVDIFNSHLLIRLYVCHLLSHHMKESTKGGGRGRLLYMVAGEAASIAKTYRGISKCALNMYIDAYISHTPLESLSSQSSSTQLQACSQMHSCNMKVPM